MDIKDRLEFRALQAAFFEVMVKYPNDKDKMELGFKVFEEWIDKLVDRELSKIFGRNATIKYRGEIKGGGGSGAPGNIIH